ncbi:MAG: DNA repair protein RecN [Saprospiraceae bacterium]|nr:DNA repair protein RecN [Saprospiraceae bacterium]
MLKLLEIKNYALIQNLSIELDNGLNIITGETGAGKSILLGALGLIMGKRADLKVLFNVETKCVVEGKFDLRELNIKAFFEKQDLEYEDELIIRREIAPSGKSRAFINDSPVTLDQLQELAYQLVDLHQQFDTLAMHKQKFQQEALDALAEISEEVAHYGGIYQSYKKTERTLGELREKSRTMHKEVDFITFQLTELNEAKLQEEEQTDLEGQLDRLTNAGEIRRIMDMISSVLEAAEPSVSDQLTLLMRDLSSVSAIDKRFQAIYDRLHSALEEIRDIAGEAEDIAENTESDDRSITRINDRLNILYRLQKKHGVETVVALIEIRDRLAATLEGFEQNDEEVIALEKKLAELAALLTKSATTISAARKKAVPVFEARINELLGQLSMPNARLKVEVKEVKAFTPTGLDEVQFLFATNKGSDYLPLKDVASGGELARLTLCLKSVIADKMELATMIFDEIDTGVSGEVASRMGQIMQAMSKTHQLICITHSPQIASKAHKHYYVYKNDEDKRTVTSMKLLSFEERLMEVAKMLSGDKPGKAAIENARELLTINH